MIEMMLTLHIPMSEQQYDELRARAQRRGIEDVATYLLVLAARDLEEDDFDAESGKEHILKGFKQAWHDVMMGNTYPASILWDDEFWDDVDDE